MKLWHQSLIPLLPSVKDKPKRTNQLGGQHTEIRMIFGTIKKNGKVNHSTVNYVNNHPLYYLKAYGLLVIIEMLNRGYNISESIIKEYLKDKKAKELFLSTLKNNTIIYPEHDKKYLDECIKNLKNKKINISI